MRQQLLQQIEIRKELIQKYRQKRNERAKEEILVGICNTTRIINEIREERYVHSNGKFRVNQKVCFKPDQPVGIKNVTFVIKSIIRCKIKNNVQYRITIYSETQGTIANIRPKTLMHAKE